MTLSSVSLLLLPPALLLPVVLLSASAVAVCAAAGPASAGMADPLDLSWFWVARDLSAKLKTLALG
jgi:hypothetical protein